MLEAHAKIVKHAVAKHQEASAELAAAVKLAFPIGAVFELRRSGYGGSTRTIVGRVTGYSPSNPREVWFAWECSGRMNGQCDRFSVAHEEARVVKYAL